MITFYIVGAMVFFLGHGPTCTASKTRLREKKSMKNNRKYQYEQHKKLPILDEIVLTDPDLTTLATAFLTANLNGTLCNTCNFTVFAPTNDAFAYLNQTLLELLLTPSWRMHLVDLLSFHVTFPTVDRQLTKDFKDGQVLDMINGEQITVRKFKRGIELSSPQTPTSSIVEADILASNGALNKIDSVLIPGFFGVNVFALGDAFVDFTTLQELLELDGLKGREGGLYTLLAPDNGAFASMTDETLMELKNNPIELNFILENHVISGVYPSETLVDGQKLTTLGGRNVTVSITESNISETERIIRFNGVPAVQSDLLAMNGIAYRFESLVFDPDPASDVPSFVPSDVPSDYPSDIPTSIPSLFDVGEIDPELTILDDLFEIAGLDDLEGEFTLLAPDNDAWLALGNDTLARLQNNIDVLGSLLRGHLIAGIYPPSDLINGAVLPTLAGLNVTVSPTVARSLQFLAAQQQSMLMFNEATSSDIYYAGNGIIYKIDRVLFDQLAMTLVPTPTPTSSPIEPDVVETTVPTETPVVDVTPDPTVSPTLEPSVPITSEPISSNFPSMTPNNVPCNLNQPGVECCVVSDCDLSSSIGYVCEANKCIGQGDPRFTLTWFGDDDLDLHVITPNGFEIFYRSPIDSESGGQLDQDDIPRVNGSYVENVFFPLDGSAPNGTYTYFVDNFGQIGLNPDTWTLQVFVGVTLISSNSGATVEGGINQMFNYTRNLVPSRGCTDDDSCDDANACTIDTCTEEGCSYFPSIECGDNEACDPIDGLCKNIDAVRPCIAIIDESSISTSTINELWREFRTTYPFRQFCLLIPNEPTVAQFFFPTDPDFLTDNRTATAYVNRDGGNTSLASDYLAECGYSNLAVGGIDYVGLFVDESGSMDRYDVRASLILLFQGLEALDVTYCTVVNAFEDWITPFDTELAENCTSNIIIDFTEQPTVSPTSATTPAPIDDPAATPAPVDSGVPPPPSPVPREGCPEECAENEACDPIDGFCKSIDTVRPCIAIIDESDVATSTINAAWKSFRTNYPFRPFCLLIPNTPSEPFFLPTDPSFLNDTRAVVAYVERDMGDSTLASNYLNECRYSELATNGIDFVGLFIDESGSMNRYTVRASLQILFQDLEALNVNYCTVLNGRENWIRPFNTTLASECVSNSNIDFPPTTAPTLTAMPTTTAYPVITPYPSTVETLIGSELTETESIIDANSTNTGTDDGNANRTDVLQSPNVAKSFDPTAKPQSPSMQGPTPEPISVTPTKAPIALNVSVPETPSFKLTSSPMLGTTLTPIDKSTSGPTVGSTLQPVTEPTNAPTVIVTKEPTAEPTSEPIAAPTNEPTPDPTIEPTVEPTAEPTERPESTDQESSP